MPAYIVIDRLAVTDPDAFRCYGAPAKAAVTRHGGRYVLPHGTHIEALEGNWTPRRIVLIEFEDTEQARRWWDSPEYAAAKAIHSHTTISNIILVDSTACSSAEPHALCESRKDMGGRPSAGPRH